LEHDGLTPIEASTNLPRMVLFYRTACKTVRGFSYMTPERIKQINESFYKLHMAIPLTKGMKALIDDEDYERIAKYKWHFSHRYAVTAVYNGKNKKDCICMHNMLMNTPDGMEVDHIDGDGLNNRRSNLRICTHAENLRNQKLNVNNKFGVSGVCLHSCKRFFLTRIVVNRKVIHLGTFRTLEEAKRVRLEAEIKYFGDFRRK